MHWPRWKAHERTSAGLGGGDWTQRGSAAGRVFALDCGDEAGRVCDGADLCGFRLDGRQPGAGPRLWVRGWLVLRSARPTAAAGRNAGWRAASGDFVFFLDGDTLLAPGFVCEALRSFADDSVAVVWGHRRETFATGSLYNRGLDLDWVYAPGEALFCGGDALFRRDALERTGGFDETLIAGEEPELSSRIRALGLRILHVDQAMTGHDLAITHFGQYWRRATRAGHAYAEVSSRRTAAGETLWREDSRRNVVRGSVLVGVGVLASLGAAIFRSVWPLAAVVVGFTGLALRTAWKARWKSRDSVALVLYGVHSHLQQIPILVGQVRFWLSRRAGRQVALVEYKQP